MAFQMSNSPNSELIMDTLNELIMVLPEETMPIIHSDQGWHYQLKYYIDKLSENDFVQSMPRKRNCLDNAPIENFFHLYKTECLDEFPPCENIEEPQEISKKHIK
ncbi:transposase [Companilactobacillus sp. FL22-3]